MSNTSHPAPLALEAGTHALCTCGLSKNGRFCDSSHTRLNAAPAARRPWWKVWG